MCVPEIGKTYCFEVTRRSETGVNGVRLFFIIAVIILNNERQEKWVERDVLWKEDGWIMRWIMRVKCLYGRTSC